MTDAHTVVTNSAPGPKPKRTSLKPCVALSRAHLALQARPTLVSEWSSALVSTLAAHLTAQLGVRVAATAKLADATLDARATLAKHAAFVLVEWTQRGAVCALELDPRLLAAVLARIAGADSEQPPTQLTRIDEAALGWLVLSAIGALQTCESLERAFGPRLVGLSMNRSDVRDRLSQTTRHLSLELSLRVGERDGKARLIFPALALQAALEPVATSLDTSIANEVLAAGFETECRGGLALLARRDIAALRAGDVVVFAGLSAVDARLAGSLRLTTKHFALHAELSTQGLTLTRAVPRRSRKEHPAMSNEDPLLPVEVEVELTKLRLTLADLSTLRSGAVLPLHINAAQTVTLRIGDKAVAKAELVDIEGEVGARIITLL